MGWYKALTAVPPHPHASPASFSRAAFGRVCVCGGCEGDVGRVLRIPYPHRPRIWRHVSRMPSVAANGVAASTETNLKSPPPMRAYGGHDGKRKTSIIMMTCHPIQPVGILGSQSAAPTEAPIGFTVSPQQRERAACLFSFFFSSQSLGFPPSSLSLNIDIWNVAGYAASLIGRLDCRHTMRLN